MTPARVVVVGLGPAGVDLMLPVARAAYERIPHRYLRTRRHPAAAELDAAGLDVGVVRRRSTTPPTRSPTSTPRS